jgi:hypothetical protein
MERWRDPPHEGFGPQDAVTEWRKGPETMDNETPLDTAHTKRSHTRRGLRGFLVALLLATGVLACSAETSPEDDDGEQSEDDEDDDVGTTEQGFRYNSNARLNPSQISDCRCGRQRRYLGLCYSSKAGRRVTCWKYKCAC